MERKKVQTKRDKIIENIVDYVTHLIFGGLAMFFIEVFHEGTEPQGYLAFLCGVIISITIDLLKEVKKGNRS